MSKLEELQELFHDMNDSLSNHKNGHFSKAAYIGNTEFHLEKMMAILGCTEIRDIK